MHGTILSDRGLPGVSVEERQIRSLLSPGAYPDPAADVRLLQTHISWIFLAGAFAYKIKKPVNFDFLDFSTLERRRFYCQEEVRLNRRLCPEIYLGVVPLRETAEGVSFKGDGPIVDYGVKMLRLPEERMVESLLSAGELTAADVRKIAATVAEFHRNAARSGEIDHYGSVGTIRGNWEENFRQAEAFVGVTLSPRDFALIRGWVENFLAEEAGLFDERVKGGFIRECDGDIHLENICLTDRVCIFDCIEFNDRFRCSDTVADIAFPLMDLEFNGRRDLAQTFLNEYIAASGDNVALELVDFYRVYRAFIRGKVESFRLNDPGIPEGEKLAAREKASRYFRLARGYVLRQRVRPALLIFCGLTGSGKSTIAAALGTELGLDVLSSDRFRKELAGVPLRPQAGEGYDAGIYSPAQTEATYRELAAGAARLLAAGRGAIVDATCKRRSDRERLRRVAAENGAELFLIAVAAPEEVIRQRLTERVLLGTGISDGNWEIYLRQREEFEPLAAEEGAQLLLDSSVPLAENLDAILAAMGLIGQQGQSSS